MTEDQPTHPPGQATLLMAAAADGDEHAVDRLYPLVYDELRALARARMSREPAGHTLQPTALVNEAYLRLVGSPGDGAPWRNRSYFFAAASEAMRRILVDRARRVARVKHGGDARRVTLDEAAGFGDDRADEVLAIDQAIDRLAELDPAMAEVVKLRFYVGLTVPETARATDRSVRTVERQWTAARAFLLRELDGETS